MDITRYTRCNLQRYFAEALESDFEFAMSEGRAVYDYKKEIHDREILINRLYREYSAIEKQISFMEAELISDQVTPRRRRALLDEIRATERDRELLRYDISKADFALNEMRRNLNKMQANSISK